ncbi:hypothetical protein AUEXF2481DRAFT_359659 [Aureobasidium subglaciale EXF-2481]|uniref:Cryptic loci regulator 2 N-terminal domain-containing protein n=1 Tax=Aureobasidium subglaciale (strain EXF-2481) TaxID=1043005 RepID=A0A074YGK1_AURSE|nr:uncharacterized protein AUEXF2481DRAFT_359659 [Aureobasidium subglaciale EXF-2481]KAI5206987.1 hypothetical protein E4T38_03511 [Aureobasidium subglaciale]KAI5225659.1 hypothetical protein E4T40_03286 [Aureobasidium subglaciale]KAI5229081.1 hypothetical protein E4T41_03651 [Aureobasidium subglaciale]KAI5263922.1 hypothetical protein E4T46_03285 [Aureobasidium subglaciale]KEQ93212.1 hypothetical protein AUEXF2481DRAFT_359659 [Aureobasidium subglaciale EXF-2481]
MAQPPDRPYNGYNSEGQLPAQLDVAYPEQNPLNQPNPYCQGQQFPGPPNTHYRDQHLLPDRPNNYDQGQQPIIQPNSGQMPLDFQNYIAIQVPSEYQQGNNLSQQITGFSHYQPSPLPINHDSNTGQQGLSSYVAPFNPNGNTFTLSRCDSDGSPSQWPINDASMQRIHNPTPFLSRISTAYAKPDFFTDPHTGQKFALHDIVFLDLPRGYALYWKARPQVPEKSAPSPNGDYYVYGHARGRFRSGEMFAKHVHAMLMQELDRCGCEQCKLPALIGLKC